MLTRLFVEVDGMTIEAEGVVTAITGAPTADLGAQIAAWLDTIDPAEIEQAALNRQGWGSRSLTSDLLAVLRERAADAGA